MTSEALAYSVPGVTCEHCRTAIVNEVSVVAGVEFVGVDLAAKVVNVRGRDLSDEAVRAAIDEAGYEVVDRVP